MMIRGIFLRFWIIVSICAVTFPIGATTDQRPNILVIVADDLGYTDIGAYGSEIRTPNLDQLARSGLKLADFHASPACSPTRAMLLTGVDHHLTGLGTMSGEWDANQIGKPGYEGYLNFRVVTVASILRDSGFHTYFSGKWHLGTHEQTGPHRRGFEHSFVLIEGGASHFSDGTGLVSAAPNASYRENGKTTVLPTEFYSSDFFTGKLIEYIDRDRSDPSPFLAFLSFTAPHWPLQASDEYIDRYKGRYDQGYEWLRSKRIAEARKKGLSSYQATLHPGLTGIKPWDHLSSHQRKIESRKMEIYAAMVENLDHNVGRVLKYLDDAGIRDNTFIFFLSDNGAEGNDINNLADNRTWIPRRFDNRLENMGRINSYIFLGPGWAQACSGWFRRYKSFPTQGGVRVPAIVNFKGWRAGETSKVFSSVLDFTPTLLELTGIRFPGIQHKGRPILPLQGESMLPFLKNETDSIHSDIPRFGWELFGRRAFQKGVWKILWLGKPWGTGKWELFNLEEDPGESIDLSEKNTEKLEELKIFWNEYRLSNNVILPTRDTGYANPK